MTAVSADQAKNHTGLSFKRLENLLLKMEFQAVIMAAGSGSRMSALTSKMPKALLPVANKPMILYPVKMLEKLGYKECTVVASNTYLKEIERVLHESEETKINFHMVGIPDDDWGTADSIRHIKDSIKGDFMVLPCDLITDFSLHQLADVHRSSNAYLSVLLGHNQDVNDIPVPDPRINRKQVKQLIGLDPSSSTLHLLQTEADLGDHLTLNKKTMRQHAHLIQRTDLQDAHVYIMQKSVLGLLEQNKKKGSLRAEVIPYMVDRERESGSTAGQGRSVAMVEEELRSQDTTNETLLDELSVLYSSSTQSTTRRHQGCAALVADNHFVIRANSVLTYCATNFMIPSKVIGEEKLVHPTVVFAGKSQTGPDTRVGEGSKVGERCSIKRSVIGRHCVIGDKVKIANSILMDHVIIEEGVTISGSIICNQATVGGKAELKDCIVGHGKSVIAMGKFTNEVIQLEDNMIDIAAVSSEL